MPRVNRGYKRGEPYRDSRLFVIACEGEKREKEYFEELNSKSQRIKIKILEPSEDESGKSAPKWVLDRAVRYIDEFSLAKDDSLWFVMDVDNWEDSDLRNIQKECDKNQNWYLALSNPCFEVWLFMHMADILSTDAATCKELKSQLHTISKGGYNPKKYIENINVAIQAAQGLDQDPDHFMPELNRSKLYQLAQELIESLNFG